MAQLAFLISLVALGIAILAYQEAGGTKDLTKKVESLREDLRRETADGLSKLEKALRSVEPAKSKP
ncbi:MAG TPA: hypothetical protein VII47_01830 [Actinomycetota bacterium]|jgi:hypothetical protein